MLTARKGLPGHEVYAVQRNAAEFIESCGLEAELRRAMVLALKKEGKTKVEILSEFDDAWILEDVEWAVAAGSKGRLLKEMEANEEGRLTKVSIHHNDKVTSLPETVAELKALRTLNLKFCEGPLSLPERLGECKGLQTLSLDGCTGLLSLPEGLADCGALQELGLDGCQGLRSLPDLSGLVQLKVQNLPKHLKPWAASGYKAFSRSKDDDDNDDDDGSVYEEVYEDDVILPKDDDEGSVYEEVYEDDVILPKDDPDAGAGGGGVRPDTPDEYYYEDDPDAGAAEKAPAEKAPEKARAEKALARRRSGTQRKPNLVDLL